jgi:type IV pilus assembly protein PilM
MEILSLNPESFGLDISDFSLKIAKLKRKGRFLNLVSFGETKIPAGVIKEGEIKDEEALAKIIKQSLTEVKGEKIKTKNVVVSLPEEKGFLQIIRMPKLPLEDLKSAVIYEAENYIPLPIEEVYIDSQIVNSSKNNFDHYDVLIAALPKKIVDSYLSCLQKADLTPLVFEIESLSICRSLIKNGVSPFPVLLIDFGESRTSFIIFSGYSVRFTSSISVSSKKITEAIAQALNIDFEKAEELKKKYGLNIPEKIVFRKKDDNSPFEKEIIGNEKIFENVFPLFKELIKQIKDCLIYYQTHSLQEKSSKEQVIEKIILSGGGANLKGLPEFLFQELKVGVELGNPWINILPEPLREVPQLSYKESLKYATALGLALLSFHNQD